MRSVQVNGSVGKPGVWQKVCVCARRRHAAQAALRQCMSCAKTARRQQLKVKCNGYGARNVRGGASAAARAAVSVCRHGMPATAAVRRRKRVQAGT